MAKSISNPFNNSWFNPYYRPAVSLKAEAGIRLGLHIGTNFLAKTNGGNTAAKVAAFAADLFTAIPCNILALLYNILTLSPLRNKFIQISNYVRKEQDKAARQSWKPTSYKALAIDALLLATIAVVGYKYFFPTIITTLNQPVLSTPPVTSIPTLSKVIALDAIPSRSWTKAALSLLTIGSTITRIVVASLICCSIWTQSFKNRTRKAFTAIANNPSKVNDLKISAQALRSYTQTFRDAASRRTDDEQFLKNFAITVSNCREAALAIIRGANDCSFTTDHPIRVAAYDLLAATDEARDALNATLTIKSPPSLDSL